MSHTVHSIEGLKLEYTKRDITNLEVIEKGFPMILVFRKYVQPDKSYTQKSFATEAATPRRILCKVKRSHMNL